ncbi:unnamed protein product [Meloidogyne enterolobii]|uniref:Uncharacterized protein n=1 Tax=Meloidogyne enterolobii TaxID=390850 RepID=A0ACB1ALM5_MELEN
MVQILTILRKSATLPPSRFSKLPFINFLPPFPVGQQFIALFVSPINLKISKIIYLLFIVTLFCSVLFFKSKIGIFIY